MNIQLPFLDYIYLDTGILSYISKNADSSDENIRYKFAMYCMHNKLLLAVSNINFIEISEADRLFKNLTGVLLFSKPFLNYQEIIDQEIESYPAQLTKRSLCFETKSLLFEKDANGIVTNSLKLVREAGVIQKEFISKMCENIINFKKNFSPNKDGKYGLNQLKKFETQLTEQILFYINPGFIKNLRSKLNISLFKGIRLYCSYLFVKYYLAGRIPKDSDLGDFHHIFYIPYCKIIVVEKDMCSHLKLIQNNSDVLNHVEIHNKKFLDDTIKNYIC
ncbi:MAG: hypothetical protein JST55_12100 [Bacteroidetes bacterium]|nr:hypothetical protein [Bacteroidota bacterium]